MPLWIPVKIPRGGQTFIKFQAIKYYLWSRITGKVFFRERARMRWNVANEFTTNRGEKTPRALSRGKFSLLVKSMANCVVFTLRRGWGDVSIIPTSFSVKRQPNKYIKMGLFTQKYNHLKNWVPHFCHSR